VKTGNLFGNTRAGGQAERIDVLLSGREGVTVERIVSHGGRAPAEGLFDQDWTEFVVLLRGEARLVALDPEETFALKPGDWLEIPPRRKHYVASTSREPPAIWLAVHLKAARS
jgi:cupin 2 domain-containing protein